MDEKNKALQKFYNYLSAPYQGQTIKMPEFDVFAKDMEDPVKRSKIYSFMESRGMKNLPNFEDFEIDLLGKEKVEEGTVPRILFPFTPDWMVKDLWGPIAEGFEKVYNAIAIRNPNDAFNVQFDNPNKPQKTEQKSLLDMIFGSENKEQRLDDKPATIDEQVAYSNLKKELFNQIKEYNKVSNEIRDKYIESGFTRKEPNLVGEFTSNLPFTASVIGMSLVPGGQVGAFYTGMVYSGTELGSEVYEMTGGNEEATIQATILGDIIGTSEALPSMKISSILTKSFRKNLEKKGVKLLEERLTKKFLTKEALESFEVEALQEGYQTTAEELVKVGLTDQDSIDWGNVTKATIMGGLSGMLFGIPFASINQSKTQAYLKEIKEDIIPSVEESVSKGVITEEEGKAFISEINEMADDPEKFKEVITKASEKHKEGVQRIKQEIQDVNETYKIASEIHNGITKSEEPNPYTRYKLALGDEELTKNFITAIESIPEFQELQRNLQKEHPEWSAEQVKIETHNQIQNLKISIDEGVLYPFLNKNANIVKQEKDGVKVFKPKGVKDSEGKEKRREEVLTPEEFTPIIETMSEGSRTRYDGISDVQSIRFDGMAMSASGSIISTTITKTDGSTQKEDFELNQIANTPFENNVLAVQGKLRDFSIEAAKEKYLNMSPTIEPGEVVDEFSLEKDPLHHVKKYTKYRGKTRPYSGLSKALFLRRLKNYNRDNNTKYSVLISRQGESDTYNISFTEPKQDTDEQIKLDFERPVGEVPLDFEEVLSISPRAKEVIQIIGDNPKIAITGSLSLAIRGTVYRKPGKPVHDLDVRTTMTEEEIASYMEKNFPNSKKNRDFIKDSFDGPTRIIQYIVLPNDLEVVRDSSGKMVEVKGQKRAGEVTTIDFFIEKEKSPTFLHNFSGGSVNVTVPYVSFGAKDLMGRDKDFKDMENYIFYEKPIREVPSVPNLGFTLVKTKETETGAVYEGKISEKENIGIQFLRRENGTHSIGITRNGKPFSSMRFIPGKPLANEIIFGLFHESNATKGQPVNTLRNLTENAITKQKIVLAAIKMYKELLGVSEVKIETQPYLSLTQGYLSSFDKEYDKLPSQKKLETTISSYEKSIASELDVPIIIVEKANIFRHTLDEDIFSEEIPETDAEVMKNKILKGNKFEIFLDLKEYENLIYENTKANVNEILFEKSIQAPGAVYTSARYAKDGYEVSSAGDKRFSALNAKLKDGRTIEEAYQLDVKGYRSKGNDWKLGKGKKPLRNITPEQQWSEYKALWGQWAKENPELIKELAQKAKGKVLTDKFASTEISQARALAEILNSSLEAPGSKIIPNPTQTMAQPQSTTLKAFSEVVRKTGRIDEYIEAYSNWLFDQIGTVPLQIVNEGTVLPNGQTMGENRAVAVYGKEPFVGISQSVVNERDSKIWNSLTHEGTHLFIYDRIDPKSKNYNREFRSAMEAIFKEVQYRLNTDHNEFYLKNKADLDRILNNEGKPSLEEFVAHAMSGTSILREWMQNTYVSNKTRTTYLGKFIAILKNMFAKVGLGTPTFQDAMDTYFNKFFGSPNKIDYWDFLFSDSSSAFNQTQEFTESFEKMADPSESIDNPRVVRNIGRIIADDMKVDTKDYIKFIQSLSFDSFRNSLIKLPEWQKAASLYYDTHNYEFTVGEMIEKFIVQMYEYAQSLEKHPTVRLVINDSGTSIKEFGDYYRNKDGFITSNWRNKINISDQIPMLNQLFQNEFELVYLDDVLYEDKFTKNWQKISSIDMQNPDRNRRYTDYLAQHNLIFLGTWADKSTVIALKPKNPVKQNLIDELYNSYSKKKADSGVRFKVTDEVTEAVKTGQLFRTVVEDLKLGGTVDENGQLQSVLYNPEVKDTFDAIKLGKRATEVAPRTVTIQTPDRIEKALVLGQYGIVNGANGLEARAVIFNASPQAGEWMEKVDIDGKQFTVDMNKVLVNEFGTETTDGVVYYLEEGFGKVYRYLHGTINDGPIKAWIGNSVEGDQFRDPLFIKASYQAISPDSIIGKWMKQNNVTLAVSSTSVKINSKRRVRNLNSDEVEIFNIPFNNIYRDKEKGKIKKGVRGLVQSLTSNLNTSANKFYAGTPNTYYDEVLNSLLNEFEMSMGEFDIGTILQELKEMALDSSSQHEQALARLILDLAYTQSDEDLKKMQSQFWVEKDELEVAKVKRDMSNEMIGKEIGGIFHEPYFAELLKAKIKKSIHKVLNYSGNSTWAVLRPDTGWNEYNNVAAVYRAMQGKEKQRLKDKLIDLEREKSELKDEGLLASVEAEILSTTALMNNPTEELTNKIWKAVEEYIDLDSGRLKENTGYLSEAIAKEFNVQNLDTFIATMVPSDGMTAQQGVTAFIVPGMEKGTVSLNSEHTQSKVGKDFDIDTTHLTFYDRSRSSKTSWDKEIQSLRDTQKNHKRLTVEFYRKALNDPSLTEADAYSKETRLKFMQMVTATPQNVEKEYWDILDSGFELFDLFAKDIGQVINTRKYVTTKSQIGFKSHINFGGRKLIFDVNKGKTGAYYQIAMIMTNDAVDRPTNENGLHYKMKPGRLMEIIYNVNIPDTWIGERIIDSVNSVDKFLFGYGVKITSDYNLDNRDLERGLTEDLNYLSMQKHIIELIRSGDKKTLIAMFNEWYNARTMYPDGKQAIAVKEFAKSYITNMEVGDSDDSPILKAIERIPLYKIPNIGTSRGNYGMWQNKIVLDVNKGRTGLIKRISEKWNDDIAPFRSAINRNYLKSFLLTSENEELHLMKAKLISLILPIDQRVRKDDLAEKYYTDIFQKANVYSYPKLFPLLLEAKSLIFNSNEEVKYFTPKGSVFTLSKGENNTLKITLRQSKEGKLSNPIVWNSGYELLNDNTQIAKQVLGYFTSEAGPFSTAEGRYKFSKLISFGRNIGFEGRMDLARELVNNELKKYSKEDKALFWDSLLGFPDIYDSLGVSDDGIKSKDAGNLKTPLNLMALVDNPSQKTLLMLAESVDDVSGRDFAKRYAKTATKVYPGLGIDKAIEIENDIKGNIPTKVWFEQDIRDNVNDETKSWNDVYVTIYDIALNKNNPRDITEDNLGIYPKLMSRANGNLTRKEVTASIFSDVSDKVSAVNLEAIALTKMQYLFTSIKNWEYWVNISSSNIKNSINSIRNKESFTGTAQEIYSEMNLLSETNPFELAFGYDAGSKVLSYTASNGQTYTDQTISQLFDAYGIPQDKRDYYRGAIEMRKVYDYWNVKIAQGTKHYIESLYNSLPEVFLNRPIIQATLWKWENMVAKLENMRGTYFPRMYGKETSEEMLNDWALWMYVEDTVQNPEERLDTFNDLRRGELPEAVQTIVTNNRRRISVDRHGDYVHGWQMQRVLPDFIARGRYITNSMGMHNRHQFQFMNSIINDIARTEWLIYENNASQAGKSRKTITRMRSWFANQSTDRYLKSERVKTENLKVGDNVAFYYVQGNREHYIRGKVLKRDNTHLWLDFDEEAQARRIERQIERYEQTHDNIVTNPFIRSDKAATLPQMRVVEGLVEDGYLTMPRGTLTILGANETIIRGLRNMLANRANWGKYRRDRLYSKQYSDTGGVAVVDKVERSLMKKQSDSIWKGVQQLSAIVFLGTPGAGVRNAQEALYRVVQDYGWARFFNLHSLYNKATEAGLKLPANMPRKMKVAYQNGWTMASRFNKSLLKAVDEGKLSEYHEALIPILSGERAINSLMDDEKMKLVEAFAGSYIVKNGLAGSEEIGAAFVKEVEDLPTKEFWEQVKAVPLKPFLKAEGTVRRRSAFLFAYKAIAIDGLTDPQEIEWAIEKGVARANSLYDMMYRKLGEGSPFGKVALQFSQFQGYQWDLVKMQETQRKELGQIWNIRGIIKGEQTINGTTYKWNDTKDPYLPGRMARFFWQDTVANVISFMFPGFRAGNPFNKAIALPVAILVNMILSGESPDDWDLSDWIFTLLGFRIGLGLTIPIQMLYNYATEKDNIVTPPKTATMLYDVATGIFEDEEKSKSTEWYETGKWSKFLLGSDLTPHTRKYYNDAQNELTSMSPFTRPFQLFTDPTNLIPVYNVSKYLGE